MPDNLKNYNMPFPHENDTRGLIVDDRIQTIDSDLESNRGDMIDGFLILGGPILACGSLILAEVTGSNAFHVGTLTSVVMVARGIRNKFVK